MSVGALAASAVVHAAIESDRVNFLPGWEGTPLSPLYSGFISAGSDVQNGKTYDMMEWYVLCHLLDTTCLRLSNAVGHGKVIGETAKHLITVM